MKVFFRIHSAKIFYLIFFYFIIILPQEGIAFPQNKNFEEITAESASGDSSGYIRSDQYNIDVLSYKLNIDLYPKEKLLKGDAVITGVVKKKNLKELELNFYDNMKIFQAMLNDKPVNYKRTLTNISFPLNEISSDTFKLEIIYEGTPKKMGFSSFVFGEINRRSVVYSLNEPVYASTWFPCNDIPDDKALLDMRITNDSSQVSVSNGKLAGVTTEGSRRTYHWKTYYPISTYLICLYSSDYVEFDDKYISQDKADTMAITYFVFPNQLDDAKKDFSDHVDMLNYFSKTFGEYPFIKEKYGVAEFLWQLGAMEHQTITGIGSNFIGGKKFFNDIYAHELAHQWWGDAVGLKSWKDIWLNEGFASYCEALYAEHIAGPKALQSAMMSKFHNNFYDKIYDPEDLFSQTVYDKGAWVLHMLRWEVGDTAFFRILRNYFNTYKYKNASINDFKRICENISGKNLDYFFNQWIYDGTGIINVSYSWKTEKNGNDYILRLNLLQTQTGVDTYKFPLEVEVSFEDRTEQFFRSAVNKREQMIEIRLKKKPADVILDPHNWILGTFLQKKNMDMPHGSRD